LQAKENFDSTCLITPGLVTRMKTSSSQMELVQSWRLGHWSHYNGSSVVSGIWKSEMHVSLKCPQKQLFIFKVPLFIFHFFYYDTHLEPTWYLPGITIQKLKKVKSESNFMAANNPTMCIAFILMYVNKSSRLIRSWRTPLMKCGTICACDRWKIWWCYQPPNSCCIMW
jgi:hypothetical protein